jgi:hypothetical protein
MSRASKPEPDPPDPATSPGSTFLLLNDLSERWRVSVADAKRIVREEKVPYLALRQPGPGSMRICWKFIRFEVAAVEVWEVKRRRFFAPPPPEPTVPTFAKPILR